MSAQDDIIRSIVDIILIIKTAIANDKWDDISKYVDILNNLVGGLENYNREFASILNEKIQIFHDAAKLHNIHICISKLDELVGFIARAKDMVGDRLRAEQVPDVIKDKDGKLLRLG